jgi:hypothetical protein
MNGDLPLTDHQQDQDDWRALWEDHDSGYARDMTSEMSSAVDTGLVEPTDTLAVAVAGAEAARLLATADWRKWSLYTPEQVAIAASAVFSQIEAAGATLRQLAESLTHIDARGHAGDDLPREALGLLIGSSTAVSTLVAAQAAQTVTALRAIPSVVTLPDTAHDTVAAVAGLLGDVKFRDFGEQPDHGTDPDWCGCSVEFQHHGETWSFHRADSRWSLVRLSDGQPQADGSVTYQSWTDLGPSEATAHPKHLVEEIQAALPA